MDPPALPFLNLLLGVLVLKFNYASDIRMGLLLSKQQREKEKESEPKQTGTKKQKVTRRCAICFQTDFSIIHQKSGAPLVKCKNDHIYSGI